MNQQVYFNNVSFYVVNSAGQKEVGKVNASYLTMFNIDATPIFIPEYIASESEIMKFIDNLPSIQNMDFISYDKKDITSFVTICMFLNIKNITPIKNTIEKRFNVDEALDLDLIIIDKLCTNNALFAYQLINCYNIALMDIHKLGKFIKFVERSNNPTYIMESLITNIKSYVLCNKNVDNVIKVADGILSVLIENDSVHKVSFYESCPIDIKAKYYDKINTFSMEYVEKTRNEGRKSNVHEVCSIKGTTFRIVICKTNEECQFGTFKHDTHYSTSETIREIPDFAKILSVSGNYKILSGFLYRNKVFIYVPQRDNPNETWFTSRYTLIINHDSLKNM